MLPWRWSLALGQQNEDASITFQILKDEGIVIIKPSSPLAHSDFEKLTKEIDAYIEEKGGVKGVIIHTKTFPGWENFAALKDHMKFVKEHHHEVKRVAAVTDSKFLSIMPNIAKHFVAAEIKHFDYDAIETAKQWIREGA